MCNNIHDTASYFNLCVRLLYVHMYKYYAHVHMYSATKASDFVLVVRTSDFSYTTLKLEILLPMDLQGTLWTMIALCTSRTHVQLTIASEESMHCYCALHSS